MRQLKPPEDFDAQAPETFDSPYDTYAELRAKCPVAYSHAWKGFWSLTKFKDVAAAASDPRTFVTSVQNVVPKLAFTGRRPPLHFDPPEHTPYRRALNPLLSEERVAPMEPTIRRFVVELLEPMLKRGRGDICEEMSSHIGIYTFAEWMNLPRDMVAPLREAGREFNLAVQDFNDATVKATSGRLYDMARDLIARRKAEPLDPETDPTTALLAARYNGEPLPDDMIVGTVRQVLVVGIIAPTVVIGSIAVHLSRHPHLQQQLRENPDQIPAALEEFLRLYTPYRGFARTPTRDVEIGGRTIHQDEPVALVYASANRDDEMFPEADQFILNRPNIAEHIAFGRGPHNCPGAALARLELRITLEELLARTKGFVLDGEIKTTRCPEIGALSVPLRFL